MTVGVQSGNTCRHKGPMDSGSTTPQAYLWTPPERLYPDTWDQGWPHKFLLLFPDHCLHFIPTAAPEFPTPVGYCKSPSHPQMARWVGFPNQKWKCLLLLLSCPTAEALLASHPNHLSWWYPLSQQGPFSRVLLAHVQPHAPLMVRKKHTFCT